MRQEISYRTKESKGVRNSSASLRRRDHNDWIDLLQGTNRNQAVLSMVMNL
jgi:hypothetical protein